ncbi:MAG: hypothetical protein A2W61_06405 [Deltaproteobacteria bacterium RIFCSPLOWO2_01_44_7]|nr:MAG: hypothetical protein A2712_06190 [Deltaproteobacteria bacterium RIFCSPHIGHO2_01_FULL_43_49]OGQ16718.1 MAG: hypothetical protein A3D22_07315 [Deltaproteobacteria bacterium RIFCSPHIGHO2_02_FULL_44_53]OGQ29856.1 MAG: hypothetical protein A3D98_09980 [Deltaproteobacteria bacterium RIFCSPHIGHO2_12_FULL_44_21]OGQ33146.1 MAG: hypothetical protein A2979_03960 [Deltaproteobacteria bacterium RIFCSPLOWO2_01_FULL_45_74]OGQ42241.1 MAG: hypothetical protein A3I70_06265 [Deltaproteobacteria bacterium 
MQPNRLERVWHFVKPEILQRWGKLTNGDLENCQYQYDLVVEAIRRTYFEGRSHLSLEGEIRDWLNKRIDHYEKSDKIH